MARNKTQLYPDFTAEIEAIDKEGITVDLLQKIINKHKANAVYNRKLYGRYMALDGAIPISNRQERFEEENAINNKISNDFFSEIVDFKTGYFAGRPINYGYSKGDEAEEETGGVEAVDEATKAVTDFTTRNNMYGVDMETTRFASIYGYAGRLFYIDTDGNERVMPVHGYETIILSNTDISEPKYAIRYFYVEDINRVKHWTVEFYDNADIYTYKGYLSQLSFVEQKPHLFDYCPLQGIANNKEMIGDAEKVLSLIDDYDKVLSDNSNEVEAFVHAYMMIRGNITDEQIEKAQKNGTFVLPASGTQNTEIGFITKNINDAFTEHHLQRLEDNIYRFSKTPNLNDAAFGTASGISLKFKLHGLETKCGMYQAQMMNAAQYMWKLLASVWSKRQITVEPLQVTMDFTRNFPLDLASEAATVQALISAGVPKQIAYAQLSFVDDVDYLMELIEDEKDSIPSLTDDEPKITKLKGYESTLVDKTVDRVKNGDLTADEAIDVIKRGTGMSEEEIRSMAIVKRILPKDVEADLNNALNDSAEEEKKKKEEQRAGGE